MLSHPLLPKLKELRLSGMLSSLEERAELAREQKLSPVEFLSLLLDDEIDRRQRHVREQREREAGFESVKLSILINTLSLSGEPKITRLSWKI